MEIDELIQQGRALKNALQCRMYLVIIRLIHLVCYIQI